MHRDSVVDTKREPRSLVEKERKPRYSVDEQRKPRSVVGTERKKSASEVEPVKHRPWWKPGEHSHSRAHMCTRRIIRRHKSQKDAYEIKRKI